MQLQIPALVHQQPAGRLLVAAVDADVVLYLREDDWGMKKYPRHCPGQLRMGSWDRDGVLAVAVLLRLARSDATTFEHWINPADAAAVRTLQCLAGQTQVDVHVVADSEVRSLRLANPLLLPASRIVNNIRHRQAWTEDDFQRLCARIAQLYPTPASLWWNCE